MVDCRIFLIVTYADSCWHDPEESLLTFTMQFRAGLLPNNVYCESTKKTIKKESKDKKEPCAMEYLCRYFTKGKFTELVPCWPLKVKVCKFTANTVQSTQVYWIVDILLSWAVFPVNLHTPNNTSSKLEYFLKHILHL